MAKLNANTVVVGEDGQAVSLLEGATVPAWATKQVGKHLLADESAEAVPYREQKLAELKKEIEGRNASRGDDAKITPQGRVSVESYAAALEADDAAQTATSSEDGAGSGEDPGAGGSAGAASS